MPKLVDVTERRDVLVTAVLAEVGERGIEGLTVRRVAARAGMGAGLVHHYFPGGKTELLHCAVTAAVERGVQRMLAVLDRARGTAAIRAVAAELLPVTPERRLEWKAWTALWSQVFTTEQLLREQRERLEAWRALLQTLLDQAVSDAELPEQLDTALEALRLAALLDGLGLHSLIDADLLPAGRMLNEVDHFLDALR
jgi:AcrR family transcriptional regulator